MAYQRMPTNYKDLADVYLPWESKRTKKDDKLYPTEVVEEAENERVRIHYVGWPEKYDEWRSSADIVSLQPSLDVPCNPN